VAILYLYICDRIFLSVSSFNLLSFTLIFVDFCQGAPWSWKVMEFTKTIFQAWKVMENDDNVIEFLLLH